MLCCATLRTIRGAALPHAVQQRPNRTYVQCRAASSTSQKIDFAEIGKYVGATAFQAAAIAAATYGLDQVMHMQFFPTNPTVQAGTVWLYFALLSLQSRRFGILDARRPVLRDGKSKGFDDRKRPAWCPPKVVFPIVWSTITLLRATSATLIWQTFDQQLFVLPLLAFALHLCIGDTWNYINNAQAKTGVGLVFNLAFVWTSAALVDALYFSVNQTAGLTLLPMNIWLTVAAVLLYSIWDLNGREELLPTKQTT